MNEQIVELVNAEDEEEKVDEQGNESPDELQ